MEALINRKNVMEELEKECEKEEQIRKDYSEWEALNVQNCKKESQWT